MTDEPIFTVEDESDWVEIPRLEALQRLENMLTQDLVAFEVDAVVDDTALGPIETFTWLRVDDGDDQLPVLLALRDPGKPGGPMRWFLHSDLAQD